MKILFGIESYFESYGGPYTAISQKLDYLNNANIKFKLIFKYSSYFSYKLNFDEIVKNYDIIHIYGTWKPFYIKLFSASKKLNKKIITSPIGALEPWSLSQKKIKKKLAWFFYQKKLILESDYIHATCEIEKKHLIELGVDASKIKVIAHGVEVHENLSKKFNKDQKKMIFFSRIHPKKGLLELIKIWDKLDASKDWFLNIYGPVSDQEYLTKIKSEILNKKLESKIKILNPIYDKNEKKQIYLNSDCFILPSRSENFGISIAEALSFGVPVITTTDTPWKIIEEKNAGIVFKFSEQNLLNSLNKFMKLNVNELEIMSKNALDIIKNYYDKNIIFKEYTNFYKEVFKNESTISFK